MPSQMRLALSLFGVLVATAPASAAEISENSLRAADAEQMRIIVEGDAKAQSEFMHDNYERELGIGEIAAEAYLSEFHFARLFKRITGQTPHAYLASVRLAEGRRLLTGSDLSIAEIAQRVGYGSPSHFAKVFRASTGLTPTAFREGAVR